jgi:hypothetical protein
MKITGIILFIFAAINLIVAFVAAGNGAPSDVVGTKFSAVLLLGSLGGLLYYFGKRKEKNSQTQNKAVANSNVIGKTEVDIQSINKPAINKPIEGEYKNLYDELTSKCHPKNFMEPYDHQKVKVANEIYSDLLNNADDITKLRELRDRAIKELGIQFSSKELYEKLLDFTNPQKFMEDYDADKVSVANDLYQRVKDNANNITELEAIQDEIGEKGIFVSNPPEQKDDENNGNLGYIYAALIIGVILIVVIAIASESSKPANGSIKAEDTIVIDSVAWEEYESEQSKTYSQPLYCISYPIDWKVSEGIDDITEVYIGSEKENFGFTIIRFETDYSLSEIDKEGKDNLRKAGFKVLEDKQITVDGVKCYRAVQEMTYQGQRIKHISYTFKKRRWLYNIKFGSVTTKEQENLAAQIIDSFHFTF